MRILLIIIFLGMLMVSTSSAEYIDRDIVGCNTEKQLKELLSYVSELDYTSYQKILNGGQCLTLKKGTSVTIKDIGSSTSAGNTVKVIMKGRTKPIWTLQEAVK